MALASRSRFVEEMAALLNKSVTVVTLDGKRYEGVLTGFDPDRLNLSLRDVKDERGIIEKFLEEIGTDRILFGTDFPWFSHHYYIGALIGSGIGESDIRKILYENAEKLIRK